MEGPSCDICYREIKDKISLECKHELCITCFLEMVKLSGVISFKCHMCRKQYNWKKETDKTDKTSGDVLEDTIELLIKEEETNLFLPLFGANSKAFEVILRMNNSSLTFNPNQKIIQFIIDLKTQIDTETLKYLLSEFVVSRVTDDLRDIIGNLRGSSFSHFRNITDANFAHLESFYDNLVIKKYE